jgi:hypothetical protein
VNFSHMTAAHFIFIPAVLFIGVVIGWILGGRAAQDAFAAEMKRREERALRAKRRDSEKATELADAAKDR